MVLNEKLGIILLVMIPFSELGPLIPLKRQVVEQYLRSIAERDDGRAIERIGDSHPLERMVQLDS